MNEIQPSPESKRAELTETYRRSIPFAADGSNGERQYGLSPITVIQPADVPTMVSALETMDPAILEPYVRAIEIAYAAVKQDPSSLQVREAYLQLFMNGLDAINSVLHQQRNASGKALRDLPYINSAGLSSVLRPDELAQPLVIRQRPNANMETTADSLQLLAGDKDYPLSATDQRIYERLAPRLPDLAAVREPWQRNQHNLELEAAYYAKKVPFEREYLRARLNLPPTIEAPSDE